MKSDLNNSEKNRGENTDLKHDRPEKGTKSVGKRSNSCGERRLWDWSPSACRAPKLKSTCIWKCFPRQDWKPKYHVWLQCLGCLPPLAKTQLHHLTKWVVRTPFHPVGPKNHGKKTSHCSDWSLGPDNHPGNSWEFVSFFVGSCDHWQESDFLQENKKSSHLG